MNKAQVAILTFFLTSALWLVVGAIAGVFAYLYLNRVEDGVVGVVGDSFTFEEADFVVAADYQDVTRVGEETTVSVTVSNPGTATANVGSIDIYDSFLDGFEVVKVEPEPDSTSGIFDFTTFYFEQAIEAGAQWQVVFRLKAKQEGTFEGDLDVCDPDENFVTETLSIEVGP